jgi:hypothetical protein
MNELNSKQFRLIVSKRISDFQHGSCEPHKRKIFLVSSVKRDKGGRWTKLEKSAEEKLICGVTFFSIRTGIDALLQQ